MENSTDSSSEEEEGMMADHSLDSQLPLLVLPLYSLLSTKLQTKVCVVIATTTPTSLSYKTVLVAQILYCIAGIFSELAKNKIFTEKMFTDCSLVLPKDAASPNVVEEKLS